MPPSHLHLARRDILKLGAAAAALGVAHGVIPCESHARKPLTRPDVRSRKLLFVVCAHGGASIIDSFLPVLDADAGSAAATLNCFPERLIERVPGSALRSVRLLDDYGIYAKPRYVPAHFLLRHGRDVAVIGHDVSSVDHEIARQRSLDGAGIDRGRTIVEAATLRHGVEQPTSQGHRARSGGLALREHLPELDRDPVQAQVGRAFLLAYCGASAAQTIGLTETPWRSPAVGARLAAFDFSHSLHRETQSLMWSRTLEISDALITLLKAHDYLGDPALGKMWDRSLVYIATEFGRDKTRPSRSESWGTGHDSNNGSLLVSPLLKGNAVYGGVDARTGRTYGFDPETGQPQPNRTMSESDVYGIIAHALALDVPDGRRYPGVVRGA